MANYVRRVAWVELANGEVEWEYIEPREEETDNDVEDTVALSTYSHPLHTEGQVIWRL